MSQPLRILIVEDEVFIAMAIEEALEELGHAITGTATTEDNAVRLARETSPQVILMDIRLANGGDGIAAASRIRAERDPALVFLTANTEPATRLRALALQPLAILDKPLILEELKTILDQLRP